MNPKELMWAIIKRYVSLKNPKTRTELISATEEAYNSIDQRFIIEAINKLKAKIPPLVIETTGDG